MTQFQPQDHVMYSASFVRNCGGFSKELADLRGTILSLTPVSSKNSLARVRWETADGPTTKSVLTSNLAHAGKPELA